jgi:hypothetical protein
VTDTANTDASASADAGGPKPSSKRGLRETIERRPKAALAAGTAIALVIGLVVGAGIGWKVEQSRAKKDVKRLKEEKAALVKKGGKGSQSGSAAGAPAVRIIGGIKSAVGSTLEIVNNKGKVTTVTVTPSTHVETVAKASASDLAKGTHIVWKNKGTSKTDAAEVIVLPATTKLGVKLTGATANTMTYDTPNGPLTVKLDGASIEKATSVSPTAIKREARVMAQVQGGGTAATAAEVIVLPIDTTFN